MLKKIIKKYQYITNCGVNERMSLSEQKADCTGHGVPGAFMSMLGISFLNEIVRKKENKKVSEVLDHLRESIIEALQQKGEIGEQKDGMDIVLCILNRTTHILQFAGANNSLFIVTVKKELKEIPVPSPCAEHCRSNDTFENWKGVHEQIDDVTILGLRI
ncbi:MAG: SpoIIE family protein phosphatase [Bacteroidia bacterium]|nr:SpoIIE family protein phosphatase [Bacteroidia bacterium]